MHVSNTLKQYTFIDAPLRTHVKKCCVSRLSEIILSTIVCCLIGVIELYTLLQLLLLEITLSDSFVPEYVFFKNVLCTFGAKSSLQFKLMAMTLGKLTPSPDPHKDVNYRYFKKW